MGQVSVILILILGFLTTALGQSEPVKTNRVVRRTNGNRPVKPKPPISEYLTAPLDLTQTNLGPRFMGHDITAVFEAVKNSPALQDKSEFETTSAYEARRAGFANRELYAHVVPNGYFGFVISDDVWTWATTYDADSQSLSFKVIGSPMEFILDKDKPTLDGLLVRTIKRSKESYIGSNAFGATVEIEHTFSDEYGVAFSQNNWLFRSPYLREFNYKLSMPLEEAKSFKNDARLLVVCRLSEPWFRDAAHGHHPTIDEPYETIVGDNYLQVVPEQLWIFNQKTGEVLRKLSESSNVGEQSKQIRPHRTEVPPHTSPSTLGEVDWIAVVLSQ